MSVTKKLKRNKWSRRCFWIEKDHIFFDQLILILWLCLISVIIPLQLEMESENEVKVDERIKPFINNLLFMESVIDLKTKAIANRRSKGVRDS